MRAWRGLVLRAAGWPRSPRDWESAELGEPTVEATPPWPLMETLAMESGVSGLLEPGPMGTTYTTTGCAGCTPTRATLGKVGRRMAGGSRCAVEDAIGSPTRASSTPDSEGGVSIGGVSGGVNGGQGRLGSAEGGSTEGGSAEGGRVEGGRAEGGDAGLGDGESEVAVAQLREGELGDGRPEVGAAQLGEGGLSVGEPAEAAARLGEGELGDGGLGGGDAGEALDGGVGRALLVTPLVTPLPSSIESVFQGEVSLKGRSASSAISGARCRLSKSSASSSSSES